LNRSGSRILAGLTSRRRRALLSALPAGAAVALFGCDQDAGGEGQITIGSNPAGTHVYAVSAGLAKVLQERGGMRATIRPFSGSSVYIPMMQRGEIALGLNTSIDSYLSYNGLPPYSDAMTNLRLVANIFPLPIMYMVNAGSALRRIEDLRGQRVVVAFRANAALEQLHHGILATGGLGVDDVRAITVAGLPDAMRLLQEGRADAVPTGLDTALALQVHSALPEGIRYLTMGADETRLTQIMPGARPVAATPGPGSVGLDGPTVVAGVADYLNTGTHLSEDQIYRIVRTLHENWEELRRDYAQIRPTQADELAPADNLHPYHPGAIRYYREAGLWSDAHEHNQAQLLGS
jgi:uncharacterized protein